MTLLMREQEIREEAEERDRTLNRTEMLKEGTEIGLIATVSKLSEKEILDLQNAHAL